MGVLSRSKTIGTDKMITPRLLFMHACCFVNLQSWIQVGWNLLQTMANYGRDYLMPAPSTSLSGCSRRELTFVTAFARLNRILRLVKLQGHKVFHHAVTEHWTPHRRALVQS